jgi:transposase
MAGTSPAMTMWMDHCQWPSKQAYKDRNVIERCYCRLKDFRRIATRYDKLPRNYFSGLCLVAAVAFWP